ncbi:cytochrome ubiquinol oxidase subunit I [Paraburkholderia sp. MMS20-SJTR3]|uniref:Cytochrome ubiquinol oxidase subunit I n=1 Tax=Paraburkholderia sejongensis TaxID=2886946 RepID=A0ABS8JRB8_9BURK|nr:cytochrome ubiquinol oxidase subunit I [Paraburkholderia sp. MMS20-SJTR3]MCC8392263.1 cytochrome ubiquinol oxidase subunit I [Paraburkholderia sp. MMS20-SJTR3]
MPVTAVTLARAQFGFTIAFHIIFPAMSIGLASYLAVLEGAWLATKRPVFLAVYRYWLTIFAVVFGIGVVSGLVMSYEFGTNWAGFAFRAGPVVGPLMGYEVLTAFFLESGFLGVMLFGMKRVGPRLHFVATLLVALGTLTSAFWILAVNSWMQTPQGYTIVEGRFFPADWSRIIFNPSFPFRLAHMVLAAYLSVAFVVGAVGAWHLLREPRNECARLMASMALWMACIVAPVQMLVGDAHGINTLKHQPAKIAALEGDWTARPGQPLILFGMPNMRTETTDYAVEIPHLGALVLTHTWSGSIAGLKSFPRDERPFSPVVFWAFRVMVGLGILMTLLGLTSLLLRWRKTLYSARWLHHLLVAMGPAGLIALLCGWTVTEVGRQPYTVYGLLRTADSVSPIAAPGVAVSLASFGIVYAIVFGAAVVFLFRLMAVRPTLETPGPAKTKPHRSAGITPGPAQQQAGSSNPAEATDDDRNL